MSKLLNFLSNPINFSGIPNKLATLTSRINDPAAWLLGGFGGGGKTLSGQNVNGNSALTLDSWYAALRNISEDVAKLPLNVKERTSRGKILAPDHFAWTMLHEYANPCMSAMDLFQTDIQWALGHGNGYAEIVRNARGQAVEMWPIHPSRMKPFYNEDQKLFWQVRGKTTRIQGGKDVFLTLSDEDVFNLRGMGNDGILGHSVIDLSSDSIGQGLAAQKSASSYYVNATDLSGVLVAPGSLSDKQYTNMRETWGTRHEGGSENKHKMAILEGGLKFESMSSNAAEAQLLEAQGFTVERMARLLRIPPSKLMHNAGLSKGNLESENVTYHSDTLASWIKRISLEINRKIIKDPKFTAKHEVNALTLGDSKTRTQVFKTMHNHAALTPNQWMGFEGLNTIDEPWADEHYMQQNITTAKRIEAGENIKAKPAGQMGAAKNQPGESKAASVVDFDETKKAHLPSFVYAAKSVITKDVKMIKNKLSSLRSDRSGFVKWAEHFYEKQEAYIVDAFSPCCKVAIDSLSIMGAKLDADALETYALDYRKNSVIRACRVWADGKDPEKIYRNVEQESEVMAQNILNLIETEPQGAQDEIN